MARLPSDISSMYLVLHALNEGVDGPGDVSGSPSRSLAIVDDAFLKGIAGAGALGMALDTNSASLFVVLISPIDFALVDSHPEDGSAMGLGGFGAAGGVDNEPVVQILSRLLEIDKGEAMSGVEAGEDIGTHPD